MPETRDELRERIENLIDDHLLENHGRYLNLDHTEDLAGKILALLEPGWQDEAASLVENLEIDADDDYERGYNDAIYDALYQLRAPQPKSEGERDGS